MVYRRRRILLAEIDRQCRFVLLAYADASSALEKRDAERLWYSLEGLITAAARVHDLLWPRPDPDILWAAELRQLLAVEPESPLNGRSLDAVTTLSAALEAWSRESPGRTPMLTNYGPAGFTQPAPAECVRCFMPEEGRFTLFGSVFEVTPLLHAAVEVGRRAELELERMRRIV